ncbi:MAG: hypothetical protein QXE31_03045 [Candidatus Woesearchaeota archaeon]
MKKSLKAQITLFVVIGLVVLIVGGMAIFYLNKDNKLLKETKKGVSFSSDKDVFKERYDKCMKEILLEGMSKALTIENANGFLEQYLIQNFEKCLYLGEKSTLGYSVDFTNFVPKVRVYEDTIVFESTGVLIAEKDGKKIEIKGNSFTLPLNVVQTLKTDDSGKCFRRFPNCFSRY